MKKMVLLFAVLALVVASAGTPSFKGATYRITFAQPSVVNGTELKAGEYRLTLGDSKVTILNGKQPLECPAKIETGDKKFDENAIRYTNERGKANVSEIRLGGTKTVVVFNR
ncbi:MAG: hypothetical protein LAP87_27360 [Acidobacteriia bacterium]|nr:hypothetical protein [Terriglobia bacterium]